MTSLSRANTNVTKRNPCPNCTHENETGAVTCSACGVQLLAASLADISSLFTSTLQQITLPPCPVCAHANRIGTLLCENCGALLVSDSENAAPTTNPLPEDEEAPAFFPGLERVGEPPPKVTSRLSLPPDPNGPAPDPAFFDQDMVLRLEVSGVPSPILLYPAVETVIGRRDPNSDQVPDVDLGAYAGYRLGISRRHAVLHLIDHALEVVDQGSSNGTWLNGRRLTPMEPEPVRNGDQLTFGKMAVRVTFVRQG